MIGVRNSSQPTPQSDALFSFPYVEISVHDASYDFVYLSPHLDDVVLSCGGALCVNRKQGKNVLVVTLFVGEPGPPFSPIAQEFHRRWKTEGRAPYLARKEEDRQAMRLMNVDYMWLDWPEIIYRDQELENVCDDTHNPVDDAIFSPLCSWLTCVQKSFPRARFVVPLGVGSHRDHALVSVAARRMIKQSDLLLYEDFPYIVSCYRDVATLDVTYNFVPEKLNISEFLGRRIAAIELYRSQVAGMFQPPNNVHKVVTAYASLVGQGHGFGERYWRHRDQPSVYPHALQLYW